MYGTLWNIIFSFNFITPDPILKISEYKTYNFSNFFKNTIFIYFFKGVFARKLKISDSKMEIPITENPEIRVEKFILNTDISMTEIIFKFRRVNWQLCCLQFSVVRRNFLGESRII